MSTTRVKDADGHGRVEVSPEGTNSDWAGTISNLMSLAKDASISFDYAKAIDYLTTLEDIWDSKGLPEFSLELRFELHREKGKALSSQGKLEEAIEEYQKILGFCRDRAHLPVKSETFTQIGQLLGKQGDHDRALGYLQRAIGAYRRLNDDDGLCRALRNLGVIYVELGELEEAEITFEEAIEIAATLDEQTLYADMINNLGAVMNMRGNWQKALELYKKSLKIYTDEGEIRKSAYTKNNVAITFAEKGINDEAFQYFTEAYEIARKIKDASLTLIVDINLADLYLKRDMPTEAREHCRKAEDFLSESNLRNGHYVEVLKTLGKISAHVHENDQALGYFDRAYDICREIGAQYLEAEVLVERGTLRGATGRHFDALNDLESSFHIYRTLKAEGKREQTEEIINSIEDLYLRVFDSMAKEVDLKDPYTKGHSDRVASLSLLLAKELGLRSSLVKTIVAGALLHDIGKIRIDDSVLKKNGRLTDEEFRHIKKHPELGVELLRGKEFPWDLKPLILHHHEHMDGSGYPMGLKGEDIPLAARVVCVADVFDALTSDRVYRKAFPPKKALEIMCEEEGKTFDPVILTTFRTLIESGRADLVINSRTREDEMYSIWSQCMDDDEDSSPETESDVPEGVEEKTRV